MGVNNLEGSNLHLPYKTEKNYIKTYRKIIELEEKFLGCEVEEIQKGISVIRRKFISLVDNINWGVDNHEINRELSKIMQSINDVLAMSCEKSINLI